MILAMGKDIRVVLIKLADRLHNMRTLKFQALRAAGGHCPRNAGYLRAAGAPAGRISIKAELEDLSLRYIDPGAIRDLAQQGGPEAGRAGGKHPHGH